MTYHCIICGSEETARFLYRMKDITVCLCAKHINEYADREITEDFFRLNKPLKVEIPYNKYAGFNRHGKSGKVTENS